jgi:hypothetical protein
MLTFLEVSRWHFSKYRTGTSLESALEPLQHHIGISQGTRLAIRHYPKYDNGISKFTAMTFIKVPQQPLQSDTMAYTKVPPWHFLKNQTGKSGIPQWCF